MSNEQAVTEIYAVRLASSGNLAWASATRETADYMATDDGDVVVVSRDGGQTWSDA
jgi:hypothetical protein